MAEENGNVQIDLRVTVRSTRKGYTAYLNIAGERFQGSAEDRVNAIYTLVYNIVYSSSPDRFKDALELLLADTTFAEAVQPSAVKDINGKRKAEEHADKK